MLETKVMVAPNSPKLRAKARIIPAMMPGSISGKVTATTTQAGPAPNGAQLVRRESEEIGGHPTAARFLPALSNLSPLRERLGEGGSPCPSIFAGNTRARRLPLTFPSLRDGGEERCAAIDGGETGREGQARRCIERPAPAHLGWADLYSSEYRGKVKGGRRRPYGSAVRTS